MGFDRCSRCGDFHWSDNACQPAWSVWCPEHLGHEGPEDGKRVHAVGPEYAAEKWAERQDSESLEYSIVGGESVVVHVVPYGEPEAQPKTYMVSGEPVPTYSAREVDDDDDEAKR